MRRRWCGSLFSTHYSVDRSIYFTKDSPSGQFQRKLLMITIPHHKSSLFALTPRPLFTLFLRRVTCRQQTLLMFNDLTIWRQDRRRDCGFSFASSSRGLSVSACDDTIDGVQALLWCKQMFQTTLLYHTNVCMLNYYCCWLGNSGSIHTHIYLQFVEVTRHIKTTKYIMTYDVDDLQ